MSDLITTPDQLQHACDVLARADVIAFDTEFIRESTYYPILALIQVATDRESFLIDPTVLKKEQLTPLQEIFTNPKILKILHSAQADEECLWTMYGYLATPIFDTSVAASLLGMGDQIGLGRLLEDTVNISIAKGHSRTNWLQRPLPKELLNYAREDVSHLVAVYRALDKKLVEKERHDWAMTLSQEWAKEERFIPNTITMATKIGRRKRMDAKALSLLARLMDWREKTAQQQNVPRRRIADEQALIDIAVARPKEAGHLHSFRGISRSALHNCTNEIIALCIDMSVIPELANVRAEKSRDSSDDKLAVELVQYAVKILAIQHRLSAKHLMDSDAAAQIAFGRFAESKDWVEANLMTSDIHAMIGEELWAFVNGKLRLSLEAGKVQLK